MKRLRFALLVMLLFFAASAARVDAQTVTAQSVNTQKLTLSPAAPITVTGIQASPSVQGSTSYWYWIVAHVGSDVSAPQGPAVITNGPASLGGFAVNTVTWNPVSGATSYDVLRTSSSTSPAGACNCAVIIGVAQFSATDSSNSLLSYTVSTSIDQVPVVCTNVIGCGSAASLANLAPNQNLIYVSKICGVQANCFAAKLDVVTAADASVVNGSNVITCPDCFFLSRASIGEILFATDSSSSIAGVNTCLDNPYITFGGANQTTILSVDSDTQIHVVGNANVTSAGKACVAYGDDDTGVLNAAWNAGGCTTHLHVASGFLFFSAPIFQRVSGCPISAGQGQGFQAPSIVGDGGVGGTYLIPLPSFNFAPITGGAVGCNALGSPECTGAVGNQVITEYRNIFVWGLGQQCSTLANTMLWVAGLAARLYDSAGLGWCGQGGGSTLYGINVFGDEDIIKQGSTNFFGSKGLDINSQNVTVSGEFVTGVTSTTLSSGCGIDMARTHSPASAYFVDDIIDTCVGVGTSGNPATASFESTRITGNPNGSSFDSACLFLLSSSTVSANLTHICDSPQTNEAAVDMSTGTGNQLFGRFLVLTANGTATVIKSAPQNYFVDYGSVAVSGGAGKISGGGSFYPSGLGSGQVGGAPTFLLSGCSSSTPSGVPGSVNGSYHSGVTGTCTVTITFGQGYQAPNGWNCKATDLTTPADIQNQTASTVSTAVISGTTVTGDVVSFSCVPY